MPGIVGLVTSLPRERAEPQLLRMVEALRHEPFYATGIWIDESFGVYVGWIARKDSFSDGMPLRNERGDVLVFSGEEFPEPGTAQRLRERGHRLETDGPEYLVHLYEEDRDFLARLNGRFHGMVADRNTGTATLFNDRYGMHRMYYHASADAFYFAAEAKAILEVRPELRRVDPRALSEFVSCGCVMGDRTLFPSIHVLPGAAAWTFRRGTLERKTSYFRPEEWENQPELEPSAFYRELRSVVSRIVPRYFAARERIAVSLTGGLDTRVIMASQDHASGALPCYTFGGTFRDSHDVRVARQVAAACGQPHQVIPVGGDFLSRFPRYAERSVYLTDGCVDVSHSADLYLNERAREIAPIRMTGNYGGEVLRRVVAFKPEQPSPGLFDSELTQGTQEAYATYRQALARHPVSFAVFHQAPWHHYGLLALEQTQVALRSPYLDNDLLRTVFRAPQSALATPEVCTRLISDASPVLSSIRTDRGFGDQHRGAVARLSRTVIDVQRKAEYAYDYGMPQWLAPIDRVLAPLRPERLFLGRHKFCHFRVWYRDALSGYLRDVLLDSRALSRPYLEPNRLEVIVRDHIRGVRNHTTAIHKILSLELVYRLFVDR